MSTNPKGRSFLSYKRTEEEAAALLIRFQQRRGIFTWQDIENLGEGSTEGQIRAQLQSPETANGVLWLTPSIDESSFIRRIEIPQLMRRLRDEDAFFLVTAIAGGLDYKAAAALIQDSAGVHDISTWNLIRIEGELSRSEAREVAQRVMHSRLAMIAAAGGSSPIKVEFGIRRKPVFNSENVLSIDWASDFNIRHAEHDVWNLDLLPALNDVVDALEQHAKSKDWEFYGTPTISAAVALGITCLQPRQLSTAWRQRNLEGQEYVWKLGLPREDSGFSCRITWRSPEANDVGVLVNVSDDVESAFAATRELPPLRAIASFRRVAPPPHSLEPGEAVDLAVAIRDSLRKLRQDLGSVGRLHLFMAVPVGLAFLLGQLLNTFGEVLVYEHVPAIGDAPGQYRPEVLLRLPG